MTDIKTGFIVSITAHFLFFLSITIISRTSSKIYYIPIQVIGMGGGGGGGDLGGTGAGGAEAVKAEPKPLKEEPIKPGDIIADKKIIVKKGKDKTQAKTAAASTAIPGTGTDAKSGTGTGTGAGSGPGGGLGVDVGNFPYIGYVNVLRNKVAQNWTPPSNISTGTKKVLVYFKIMKTGRVEGITVKESSGASYADRSAIRAVINSSPFPPLPSGFPDNYLGVNFMFTLSGS